MTRSPADVRRRACSQRRWPSASMPLWVSTISAASSSTFPRAAQRSLLRRGLDASRGSPLSIYLYVLTDSRFPTPDWRSLRTELRAAVGVPTAAVGEVHAVDGVLPGERLRVAIPV